MKNKEAFTVIVADDEEELRQAVCDMIPWEGLGFRLIGNAGNGLEALQMTELLQPDLLLTDIRMPYIMGTELARQVREVQPLIQVAFLSGYDDFEYAQAAIDSGVISYLLKPVSMADFSRELRGIREKMEFRFRRLLPEGGESGGAALAVAALLLDPASEQRGETEIRRMLAEEGFSAICPCEFCVLSIEINSGNISGQNIARTVDRVLEKHYLSRSFSSAGHILTLVIAEEIDFAVLGGALDELYNVIRRLVHPRCAIGVSRVRTSLSHAFSACREAMETRRILKEGGLGYTEINGERRRDGISALCGQALRMIEQHYMDESLSLNSVSKRLHVSPNYLSANMKRYAGDTFVNLLIKRRMEAARFLIDGNLKIAEVAYRCGYSDQHYFSYCFKKYYGVSPAGMRRGKVQPQ